MSELSQEQCVPCQGGVPALDGDKLDQMREKLPNSWEVVDGHHLEREYDFDDFKQALDFTNQVGEVAEAEGHHPDIYLTWGTVRIKLYTHKIDGLHRNDFIMASKIEELYG